MRFFYIFMILVSIPIYADEVENKQKIIDKNIDNAMLFLNMACVTGGEKIIVDGNTEVGLTLRQWKKAGVQAHIRVRKEAVKGLIDSMNALSVKNAENTRQCIKPYIKQIMNTLFPPTKEILNKKNSGSATTQAGEKNATSSGATPVSTCSSYAGPNGAVSTCARNDGRGVTTGVNERGAHGISVK